MTDEVTAADARRLALHLIGEPSTDAEAARWVDAVQRLGVGLERPRDRRLWTLAMRRPSLTGLVDAGLAVADPNSPVRHRIYLMLAILEASPAHCRRFLPAPWPRLRLVGLAARAALAAARVVAGLVLVRVVGAFGR